MNGKTIKAVVFDLEGTVVDVESAHHQGHIAAAEEVGVKLTLEDCFKKIPHFIGGPDDEIAKEIVGLAREVGAEADTNSVLARDKFHYERLLKELEIGPRDGFVEFYSQLDRLAIKMAIGSLTSENQAKILLDRSHLDVLFDTELIVLREHVKNPKPAPDVWIEAARRLAVEPSELLVFEDSPRGIVGAVSVGATCVGMPVYNRPDTVKALIDAGAKRVFMSWEEIRVHTLLTNLNKERQS